MAISSNSTNVIDRKEQEILKNKSNVSEKVNLLLNIINSEKIIQNKINLMNDLCSFIENNNEHIGTIIANLQHNCISYLIDLNNVRLNFILIKLLDTLTKDKNLFFSSICKTNASHLNKQNGALNSILKFYNNLSTFIKNIKLYKLEKSLFMRRW